MEEQRQRQEDEARRTAVASATEASISSPAADGEKMSSLICSHGCQLQPILLCSVFVFFSFVESEDALLKMAVAHTDSSTPALLDFSRMTEDEQIAYAMQMSMQGAGAG